jgi:BirA family transcriptional regulator, biotin operon repressor / biotin---[acetyl-CoA-carboxylase] ligase
MQSVPFADRILTLVETGSTNDDLLRLAREGAPEGLWLRAERQTGGRGRQGRTWSSPSGNLYASALVRLRPGDPPAPSLALVAAVALHEAVNLFRHPGGSRAPRSKHSEIRGAGGEQDHGLVIKWPNDLLVGRAKLAGVLLERADDAVVIGFGANLAHHPKRLDRPTTSLAALTGAAPDPAAVCETLTEAFARWLRRWRSEGLARIRSAWLAAAHPPGTALSTVAGEGLFDGLTETGSLLLRRPDGTTATVHAGDVFLI